MSVFQSERVTSVTHSKSTCKVKSQSTFIILNVVALGHANLNDDEKFMQLTSWPCAVALFIELASLFKYTIGWSHDNHRAMRHPTVIVLLDLYQIGFDNVGAAKQLGSNVNLCPCTGHRLTSVKQLIILDIVEPVEIWPILLVSHMWIPCSRPFRLPQALTSPRSVPLTLAPAAAAAVIKSPARFSTHANSEVGARHAAVLCV